MHQRCCKKNHVCIRYTTSNNFNTKNNFHGVIETLLWKHSVFDYAMNYNFVVAYGCVLTEFRIMIPNHCRTFNAPFPLVSLSLETILATDYRTHVIARETLTMRANILLGSETPDLYILNIFNMYLPLLQFRDQRFFLSPFFFFFLRAAAMLPSLHQKPCTAGTWNLIKMTKA